MTTRQAKSFVLYKKGNFQIEFLYIPRGVITPPHTHPNMRKKILYLFGRSTFRKMPNNFETRSAFVSFPRSLFRLFNVRPDEIHWADPPEKSIGILIFEWWSGKVKTELTDLNYA